MARCGGRLVTGGDDKAVKLWSMQPWLLLYTLRLPEPPIMLALPNPDTVLAVTPGYGAFLFTGAGDAARPAPLRARGFALPETQPARAACAAAWDQYLAVGSRDGGVRVYDTYSGSMVSMARPHGSSRVLCMLHARHGNRDVLFSGGSDGRVAVTDMGSMLCLAETSIGQGGGAVIHLGLDARRGLLLGVRTRAPGQRIMWDVGIGLSAIPTQPTLHQATGQAGATPARLGMVWQHQPPVPSLAGSRPVIGLVALDYGCTFAISAHTSLDLVSGSGTMVQCRVVILPFRSRLPSNQGHGPSYIIDCSSNDEYPDRYSSMCEDGGLPLVHGTEAGKVALWTCRVVSE